LPRPPPLSRFAVLLLHRPVRPAGTRVVKVPLGEELEKIKRRNMFNWDPKELGPLPTWDNEWRQVKREIFKRQHPSTFTP
jgi:hypothetical protein